MNGRFVRLDFKHAQSEGKSANRGLPVLDPTRGRPELVAVSGDENERYCEV